MNQFCGHIFLQNKTTKPVIPVESSFQVWTLLILKPFLYSIFSLKVNDINTNSKTYRTNIKMLYSLADFSTMEINVLLGHTIRPYSIGHLVICTLGIFGLVGRLIDARHHDNGNLLQQHPLMGQNFESPSSPASASSSVSSISSSSIPSESKRTNGNLNCGITSYLIELFYYIH